MVNDPIGDLIARIKNAAMRGRNEAVDPSVEDACAPPRCARSRKATSAATTWWKSPAPSLSSRSS